MSRPRYGALVAGVVLISQCGGELKQPLRCPSETGIAPAFISINSQTDSGQSHPNTIIDSSNQKIIIATDGGGFYECNLDGSNCTFVVATGGNPANWGEFPSPVLDNVNKQLVIAVNGSLSGTPLELYRCDLTGVGCSVVDISAGQTVNTGGVSAAIDTSSGKLLVATNQGLFRCNLDGTEATFVDISVGHPDALAGPATLIDTINKKVLVITTDFTNLNKPILFRCNLDGTACSYIDISAGRPQSGAGSAVIDELNSKLLVTTCGANCGPALLRCNLDGSGCAYTDLSPVASGYGMSIALDMKNGQIVVAVAPSSSQGPGLIRCDLDGTKCIYTDISAGHTEPTGWESLSVAIDTVNSNVVVAGATAYSQRNAVGGHLGLFLAGVCP